MSVHYSLISIELTESEQEALLGLLIEDTNRLIAHDPNNWLGDLERIEEKINSARESASFDNGKPSIVHEYRAS